MEILPVQPFQETLHAGMCGPASLKMVLAYYGIERSEAELVTLCGTDPVRGTTAEEIARAAKSLGCTVEIHDQSSFEDIRAWLDRGVPVIVDWFTRGRSDYPDSEVPDGHLSVVVGLDADHIYLQDPEIGKLRQIRREDFMRVWFDFTGDHISSWDEMIVRQLIAIYT